MNTKNNEQDKFLDLLTKRGGKAASPDVDSHNLRIHLKNQLGDQEVVNALIDYASTLAKAGPKPGNHREYGNRTFTDNEEIDPQSECEDSRYETGRFTTDNASTLAKAEPNSGRNYDGIFTGHKKIDPQPGCEDSRYGTGIGGRLKKMVFSITRRDS
jgi:hypothetical protein